MAAQDLDMEVFSYETKLLVLNFLNLLPTDLVSQSSSTSASLISSGSSAERQKRSLSGKSSPEATTSADGRHERSSSDTWQRSLPSLPETTLAERVMNHDKPRMLVQEDVNEILPRDEDETDTAPTSECLQTDGVSDGLDHLFEEGAQAYKPVTSNRSPTASKSQRSISHETERQTSSLSVSSDMTDASDDSSLMMSAQGGRSRSGGFIDLQRTDVDQLVHQGLLRPEVLPLKHELNQEMDEIRKRKSRSSLKLTMATAHPGFANHPSALTPESEVAEQLRIIGDYVQKEYGTLIEKAISTMVAVPNDQLSYEFMENIVTEVTQHLPDIPQRVAVVMLLTQRLAVYGKDVHRLIDFTVTFVMKKMASYILKHGGWSSIIALEFPDLPVSPSNITAEFSSTDQVDSSMTDLPNGLPDVSASGTLILDQNGEAGVAADSGFPSVASSDQLASSTGVQELSRAATLDSISSLSHDVTPSETLIVRSHNIGTCNSSTDRQTDDVAGSASDQQLDTSTARQGQLLRQVSEKLNHKVENDHFLASLLQAIAAVTLGSVCVVFTAVVLYKRLARR